MNIPVTFDKSLLSKFKKLNIIEKKDFFAIEKLLKEKNIGGTRGHIKNVITAGYTTTEERLKVMIEYYTTKLDIINNQKKLAKNI